MTIGVAAFIVVVLGALGAYVVLGGAASSPAIASQTSGIAAQAQQLPGSPSQGVTGGSTSPQAPQADGPSAQSGYSVSPDDAANIALSSVPGSTLLQQPRLVNFNGTVAYEVSLDRGYVYIDASSGQVVYNQANGTQGRPGQRLHRPRP
jgi:hypothetical protein